MTVFRLPDLGEGLQEAEISAWHVAEGDEVAVDQPLVAVETEKAIVDIPSPRAGRIKKLFGKPGDILKVGDPLIELEGEAAEAEADAGTVVGRVPRGAETTGEAPSGVPGGAGIKATPAVRALARRLNVDLSVVTPTGPNDTVTAADVERVARIFKELGPLQPLRGVRRVMARAMTQAHAEVAPVTVSDDADLAAWWPASRDLMLRLIRAIVAGCKAEPSLNAWYDSREMGLRVIEKIDLGIAVDTPDGLFVPVLRDVGRRTPEDLRAGLERLRRDVEARTIPPEELRGYTFILSNFGTFGGRYANPIVQPPTVAILGAGRVRDAVVAVDGAPAVHPILPLSLTFDHRCITGGEATRFLAAVIRDLETP
ncbi:MAG TPA: dihydrolipoamide acetyltransferase family protein [Gammaproteobacteria bacterium]